MKNKSMLTLLVSASLSTFGVADDKKGADDPHAEHSDHATEAPKTAKEMWSQLNGLEEAINAAVTKKDAHAVHARAEQATMLLQALPGKSSDLSEIAQKRVGGYVKSLAKLLDGAHDAADEGKFDGAAKSMKSYAGLIKTLKSQYKDDVTSGKTAEKDLPEAEHKESHKE